MTHFEASASFRKKSFEGLNKRHTRHVDELKVYSNSIASREGYFFKDADIIGPLSNQFIGDVKKNTKNIYLFGKTLDEYTPEQRGFLSTLVQDMSFFISEFQEWYVDNSSLSKKISERAAKNQTKKLEKREKMYIPNLDPKLLERAQADYLWNKPITYEPYKDLVRGVQYGFFEIFLEEYIQGLFYKNTPRTPTRNLQR